MLAQTSASRIGRASPSGRRPATSRRSAPSIRPATPSPDRPADQPTPIATEKNESPFADHELPAIDIRPVRLRGTTTLPPAPAKVAEQSTPSLLSDEEVERRIAELAERQGGPKIPPAKVLK
jgi:hypothetical protein